MIFVIQQFYLQTESFLPLINKRQKDKLQSMFYFEKIKSIPSRRPFSSQQEVPLVERLDVRLDRTRVREREMPERCCQLSSPLRADSKLNEKLLTLFCAEKKKFYLIFPRLSSVDRSFQ